MYKINDKSFPIKLEIFFLIKLNFSWISNTNLKNLLIIKHYYNIVNLFKLIGNCELNSGISEWVANLITDSIL